MSVEALQRLLRGVAGELIEGVEAIPNDDVDRR
jgi:hypothetical protein